MNIATSYLPRLTGLTAAALFDRGNPLVVLEQDASGVLSITTWKVPNVTQPSAADLAAAVAAPEPPPSVAALQAYAQAAWGNLLATGETFNVAASGAPPVNVHCDGTNSTRADLALLALFGQENPTGSKTWIDNAGTATLLTGTELVALSTLAGDWIADTYPALAALLEQVASGAVNTTAEIDAYTWPAS